jgi:hypothetical protein
MLIVGRYPMNLAHIPVALVSLAVVVVAASIGHAAGGPRNLLSGARSPQWINDNLLARDQFQPYPRASDRPPWDALPPDVRAGYVRRGESLLNTRWDPLPATLFLEFAREGNRSRYERAQFQRRADLEALTLAECAEGKGRFIDQIVNGIWVTCEETYWGVPAHVGAQRAGKGLPDASEPTIDLFAAETAAQLAWTIYLLGPQLDRVSPLVCKRVGNEIERRILDPYIQRDDFWWMGLGPRKDLNNWTPWIVSNVLPCALLLDEDANRRAAIVHKSLRIIDNFLNVYPDDGGCDEGPGYWGRAGGSLLDCLETLRQATGGKIDVYRQPLIGNIARYIHAVHIADRWYVNFGDASARGGGNGALVYRFGARINDEQTKAFGAWLQGARAEPNPARAASLGRVLPELFELNDVPRDAQPPLARDVWLADSQVMIARDRGGMSAGWFLAAIGAHNAQSHNHNDVGSFIVALDGYPMLIDVGVETYTAKTFGPQRYDIWTMQSGYHNLPTINGVMQGDGRRFAAADVKYRADDESAELAMHIAGAYPPQAKVRRWHRTLKLDRGRGIEIIESYALDDVSAPLTLNLMTACQVDADTPGRVLLKREGGPGLQIAHNPAALRASVEPIKIDDARLRPVWGPTISRIQLTSHKPAQTGTIKLELTRSGS